MATLYLIEQNTILRKSSERLILSSRPSNKLKSPGLRMHDVILELPCDDVDQVMLFGNIQVTTQALQQLLRFGIELAIFTQHGKLLGQLTPPKTKNIQLRVAQFQKYHDAGFVLDISKKIAKAKLQNGIKVSVNHRKNHPAAFTEEELNKLRKFLPKIDSADSAETLRGLEGAASAAYFRLFSRMFKPPWNFQKRTRRPPKDPVNAVLSFGYTIVNAELQAILDGIGFDPYLGFYHVIGYGRPGLALDLLEEFRHPIVDRLCLNLFNLNILTEDDFFKPAKGSVYLNTTGKKKFFKQYETVMGEYTSDVTPVTEGKSYRAIFQQRVYALANAVQDKQEYEPFLL